MGKGKATQASGTFRLFGTASPKQASPKAAPKKASPKAAPKKKASPKAAPKKKASAKGTISLAETEAPSPKKKAGGFSLFGSSSPKPAAPVKSPVEAPVTPPPAKGSSGGFSFFGGGAAPKPKASPTLKVTKAKGKEAVASPKAPPKKKAFSLFGAPSPKKSTGGTIALTPAKKAGKAATKQASKAARKASPTFSLFGGGSSPKKAAKV